MAQQVIRGDVMWAEMEAQLAERIAQPDPFWAMEIITHRGISICRQYDTRGADYGETIAVEWQGESCDFNTVLDAQKWIDGELDTDWGFDPVREWGLTVSRAI